MLRAVHPPFVRHRVRWPVSPAFSVALAVAFIASGCLDDGPAPPKDDWLRLSISAQVGSARGRAVAIDVFYRRSGAEDALVPLAASPDRVTVEPGTTQQVPVTVDIVACLQDPARVRNGGRENTCPLVVFLRLLDDAGEEIDNERIEPEAPAAGETVTLPTVTLREAELVLTPATLTFSAVEEAALPAPQLVEISNGGGGSLGELSIEVDEAAEWLQAVLAEDGTHVSVQPTTTSLEPGTHTATVSVHASGAPNSPRTITVTYQVAAKPTHVLTVTGAGNGRGRVTSEPEGIDCTIEAGVATGACSASFDEGKLVFLIAEPQSGSSHGGWSGHCEGDGGCGVIVDGPSEVTATFTLVPRVLTASATGTGSGRITSEPAGLDCTVSEGSTGGGCSVAFDHGTVVTLHFEPDEGNAFGGWSGACQGSDECTVTMTEAREVSLLVHRLVEVRMLPGGGSGSGVVRSTPAGIDCAISPEQREGSCVALFPHGTQVTLTATPNAPDTFGGWEGACDTSQPTCTLTIDGSVEVGATFVRPPNTLTVMPTGDGSGRIVSQPAGIDCQWANGAATGTCSAQFPFDTEVMLSAAAGEGSAFAGWSGACSGTDACAVGMSIPQAVGASFVLRRYTVAVDGFGNGSGRVTSTPAGIDCRIDAGEASGQCAMQVAHGTQVRLAAAPDPFHRFGTWSGPCSGAEPCVFTATSHAQLTATFLRDSFVLQIRGAGSGAGTVRSTPDGAACTIEAGATSGQCAPVFPNGTSVTLTVEPSANSTFTGWSGACNGTGPCVVSMTEAQNVTATFDIATHRLTVKGAGTGNGQIHGRIGDDGASVIECMIERGVATSGTCEADLPVGTEVLLEAEFYYYENDFGGWSGACSGTEPCTVRMTENREVTATFHLRTTLTVDVTGNVEAHVTSEPGNIDCTIEGEGGPGVCQEVFHGGTVVTLTAETPEGAVFVGWGGACEAQGKAPTCTLTMDESKTVIAAFESTMRFLSVNVVGVGAVTSNPAGISCRRLPTGGLDPGGFCADVFPVGSQVVLTATPDPTTTFAGWSGACSGTQPTCTVTMTDDLSVMATFQATQTLTVSVGGTGSGNVRSFPDGVNCTVTDGKPSGTCSAGFPQGSNVTLTALPVAGSTHRWGEACLGAGTEPNCTVQMTQARNVSITFEKAPIILTVTTSGSGEGRIVSQPGLAPAIDCVRKGGTTTGACTGTWPQGTQVQLTATTSALSGHVFDNWTGVCTGTSPTCILPGSAFGAVSLNAAFDFDECEVAVPHTVPSQTSAALDDFDDCRIGAGIYRDRYAMSSSTQQLYEVVLSSSGTPSELRVRLGNEGYYFSRSSVGGAHLVLAPPGTVLADVVNTTPDNLGSYILTTRLSTFEGCTAVNPFGFKRPLRTTFGVSATFALTTGDCAYIAGGRTSSSPSDLLTIYVPAGRRLRVVVQSTQFDPMIEVRTQVGFTDDDWTGTILGTSAPGHGTATLELPNTGGGYLHIWVTSRTIGGTGAYTIQILE